jgi:predicted nucleotide-binding protein
MLSRASWSNSLPSDSDLGVFQNPWSDFLCSRATLSLRIDNKPRILIVHGRSDDRLELKNYLQNSLGLPEPVILAERISPGEVLPVKFEGLAADVDGAIALGTPDDFGGLVPKGRARRAQEPRARQNVWLEVGWFWGRLGRGRVMILTRGEVAIPSDLYGVEAYDYQTAPSDRSKEIQAFLRTVAHGRP